MTVQEMKERKKELGYSLKQLSELSGVPLGTVQKIFGGETKAPRYQTIQALEKVLRQKKQDQWKESADFDYSDQEKWKSTPQYLKENAAYQFDGRESRSVKTSYIVDRSGFLEGPYTYADYLKMPDDQNVELIHGIFYDMASPTYIHQLLQSNLIVQFSTKIQKGGMDCDAVGPIDTRIEKDDKTVVQPDLSVICHPDRSRIRDGKVWGAPDLAVEILSPSTRSKDMNLKRRLYQRAGVREYWIIDPRDRLLFQFDFQEKEVLRVHSFEESAEVAISDGRIKIDLRPLKRICA